MNQGRLLIILGKNYDILFDSQEMCGRVFLEIYQNSNLVMEFRYGGKRA